MTTQLCKNAQLRSANSVLDLVGNTPIVKLSRLAPQNAAEVWVKLEFLNPGGSIKDRAALGMILDAEAKGLLTPGATIIEATAGNTGVGLALIGVNRGYRVVLYVPEGFAEEKCILMRGFGATVIRTPDAEGMAGAIRRATEAQAATPGSWAALQFQNQSNPQFHHDTTAHEIWEQLEGRVDGFVAGVGSGGTFSGIARYLKEQNPSVYNVAVETFGSILQGGTPGKHRIEGIGVSFIPETFHAKYCDEILRVTDDDAFRLVQRLAEEEGLLAGSSAGANLCAALQLAERLGPGKRVATMIPDSAERYLSKKIFEGGL